MNHRERLLATYRFEPVDRGVDYEFGAMDQTLARWYEEGLPREYVGCDPAVDSYFGCDNREYGPQPWMACGLHPAFEYQLLEEKGDRIVFRGGDGVICEQLRGQVSMPHYIQFPIATRADWEQFRDEHLDPDAPGRLPGNLDELADQVRNRDYPLILGMGSLYGWLRNWMGVENLSLTVHDDPAWVEEMMEHLTRLTLKLLESLAGKFDIDAAHWWEDMCYNHGPLLSPAHFKRWMVPRYKRITDFLRQECGCQFNVLDCDGNIHELAPLWLEGGINVMFPLEALHTDAWRLSNEFGRQMPLRGGFDKMALIAGPAAIDREFDRLRPLYERSGFIPHTDHRVPPDVSWENYCYYRQRKCELIGKATWKA